MDPKNLEKLQVWSNKIGVGLADLMKRFDEILAEQKKVHPELSANVLEQRAMYVLYGELKSQLRSRAKPYVFMAIGISDTFDLTRSIREQALAVYREDPQRAIRDGLVNADGVPIDPRQYIVREDGTQFENPRFRQPIEPVYRRQVIGIAQDSEGNTKATVLILRNENVKNPPPIGKAVKIRVVLREDSPLRWLLYDTRNWQFSEVENPFGDVKTILETAPKDTIRVALSELERWHVENQNDRYAFVITKGVVTYKAQTQTGSTMFVLEDPESFDFEAEGVTVFIPEFLSWQSDSVEIGDEVFVVGRTTLAPGWNVEEGRLDENIKRVIINGMGIFA